MEALGCMDANARRDVCEVCGADDADAVFASAHGAPPRAALVRCRSCGLVYRVPRPPAETLRAYYAARDEAAPPPAWIAARRAACQAWLPLLETYRRTGRVLDVGAGHGVFLAACTARGWTPHGLELSRGAAAYARSAFGLDLAPHAIEEARFPDAYFDVVTFWNVLDHLPAPQRALAEAYRVLRPGGLVVVRFPNADFHVPMHRWFQRLTRWHPAWRAWDHTVFHLFSFDRRTIARLLAAGGFAPVKVRQAPLVWTTDPPTRGATARRWAAALAQALCGALCACSARRLWLSPSLVATGVKPDTNAHGHARASISV